MKNKEPRLEQADPLACSMQALRRKTEKMDWGKVALSPKVLAVMSPAETQLTLRELRMYQIELEMQIEELRQAQAELDAERERILICTIWHQ